MKIFILHLVLIGFIFSGLQVYSQKDTDMKYNKLTQEEERIIIHKGTETPWSGVYVDHNNF